MEKITAIIPTFNEQHNIEAAIDSVSWADEIIVVDSFSTDETVKIAKEKGVRLLQREYGNSASQKNWTIPQAKFDWVFLLDADERVTENLKLEIKKLLNTTLKDDAYWINRDNFFMKKKIRFSGWQGDKVIRLFKRDQCRYEEKHVHAEIICNGTVGVLKNSLVHFTFKDISHYLEKWDRYSSWSARDHFKKGQRPTLFHFVFKPAFRFFRDFILRLGFLDGVTGLIVCSLSSMGIFMRYVKLKQILQDKN
jgi:glycosyltransferase involved in cell wall biosynthesis